MSKIPSLVRALGVTTDYLLGLSFVDNEAAQPWRRDWMLTIIEKVEASPILMQYLRPAERAELMVAIYDQLSLEHDEGERERKFDAIIAGSEREAQRVISKRGKAHARVRGGGIS